MTLLSNVIYPALIVAAGAVGFNLVDDSTPPQENVPPRVEVKKDSTDEKVEVTVNGQRIKVKAGEPLEIKIKSGGEERVIRLPLSDSPRMRFTTPREGMKFDFDTKEFERLGEEMKGLKFEFDTREFEKLGEEMKGLKLEFKDLEKLHDKDMHKHLGELKELKALGKLHEIESFKHLGELKELQELKIMGGKDQLKAKSLKTRELMATLTPDQKKKMKSQGYLLPKDLTPQQREMLPQGKGEWQISIAIDGETYNFRSK